MEAVDVSRRRLAAQRLSGARFERPEQVVEWLGAVQAQDYYGSLYAVGLRLRQATEATIEKALFFWKDSPAQFADCLIGARHRGLGCNATATFDVDALKLPGFVPA